MLQGQTNLLGIVPGLIQTLALNQRGSQLAIGFGGNVALCNINDAGKHLINSSASIDSSSVIQMSFTTVLRTYLY
jgi:hypothetical protein